MAKPSRATPTARPRRAFSGRAPGSPGRIRRFLRQLAPSALFVSSLLLHLCLGMVLMDTVWLERRSDITDLVLHLAIRKEKPKRSTPPPKPREIKRDIVVPEKKQKPKPEETPVKKEPEKPSPKPVEPTKFPEENPVLLARLQAVGAERKAPVIGLKASPSKGQLEPAEVDLFQGRTGKGKELAIRRGGGSDASENAVKLGLDWLARHQNRSGAWSTWLFEDECPKGDHCRGAGTNTRNFDPAMTGLSLLCFLGSGHTHQAGNYQETVRKGLRFLKATQKDDGSFGQKHGHLMYNHGIASLAMAEAYAMTHDPELKEPVRKAVLFLSLSQQPGGGWDYTAAMSGRNDTSITGWAVMALKSAKAGGIAIPWETVFGALMHFVQVTQANGEVMYADRGVGKGRKGVGMVAVGMLCREFLGWPLQDPIFRKQVSLVLKEPPTWEALSKMSFNTMYYWYYATLAVYQQGGKAWTTWNSYLRDMLCKKQRRGGHPDGSWDPDGRWFGPVGGRVYSTTMAVLCLEVYYRYLPIYRSGGGNFSADEILQQVYKDGAKQQRLQALKLLSQFRSKNLPAMLRRALSDEDSFVKLYAAEELLQQGDLAGVPALTSMLDNPNGYIRSKAINLVSRLENPALVPALAHALLDSQEFVAEKAALVLVKITGKDFGFRFSLPAARKMSISRQYQQWFHRQAPAKQNARRSLASQPKTIEAKILVIRPDVHLVMLDAGHKQGVQEQMKLYIFRNGRFIGAAEVVKVIDDELASAKILENFTVDQVMVGDKVTTRLESGLR